VGSLPRRVLARDGESGRLERNIVSRGKKGPLYDTPKRENGSVANGEGRRLGGAHCGQILTEAQKRVSRDLPVSGLEKIWEIRGIGRTTKRNFYITKVASLGEHGAVTGNIFIINKGVLEPLRRHENKGGTLDPAEGWGASHKLAQAMVCRKPEKMSKGMDRDQSGD